jgi:hypothetical protein
MDNGRERRCRQVHLDFHTSADCDDVGAHFDHEVFARTVEAGHVDQAWSTSGLNVKVLSGEREVRNAYLAPDGEALPLEKEGEYASIDMLPIGAHAVVVLE